MRAILSSPLPLWATGCTEVGFYFCIDLIQGPQ
jgi:hypothetical protein